MRVALAVLMASSVWACSDGSSVVPEPPDGTVDLGVACEVENDCPAHARCVTDIDDPTCQCVAGYQVSGDFCVFAGIRDPDVDGDPAAWQTEGDVTIEDRAADTGMRDDGVASWPLTALNDLSRMSQTLTMPPLAAAEPLVAVINQQVTTIGFGYYFEWYAPSAMLFIGSQQSRLPVENVNRWESHRVCLGESAFDGEVSLGIEPANVIKPIPFGGAYGALEIDRVQLEPATQGECPVAGEVRSGDFESLDGWNAATLDGGFAGLREGMGVGGSRAGYLEATNCYQTVSLSTDLSIPRSETGKAIRLVWQASANNQAFVGLGTADYSVRLFEAPGRKTHPITALNGEQSTPEIATICIPPYMLGTVATFEIALRRNGVACTTGTRYLAVDDVEIIDAPGCPATGLMVDPSFEVAQNVVEPGWAPLVDVGRGSQVVTVPDAADGSRVLRMTATSANEGCLAMGAQATFRYPDVGPGERPAFRFAYRFSGITDTVSKDSTLRLVQGSDRFEAIPDNQYFPAIDGLGQPLQGWQTATVCGRPFEAGRIGELNVVFNPFDCDINPDPIVAEVDHFELLSLPEASCPPP